MYSINKLNVLLLKYLIAALLLVATTSTVAAQSTPIEIPLTEEELNWIAEHPTIIAGSNTAYAPFDFISAGEAVGLSIDYLNLLASKVGLKVEYVNYGAWFENLQMGREGKIDIFPALVKNEERQEYLTFSAPYIKDDLGLWGRVGSIRINNINDLRTKRIGVIKDNAIITSYQQRYPDLNYVEFNDNMAVLRALSSNEIDVYPNQIKPVEFSIAQNNLRGLEIIGDEFVMEGRELDHRIAVHKNIPILMSIINKSIAAVTSEEFEALSAKWIKSDQTIQGFSLTSDELDWLAEHKVIKVSA